MENTSCSPSCKIKEIEIFGKQIGIKGYLCSKDGVTYPDKEECKIQLSICPTGYCMAKCAFCVAHNDPEQTRLDPDRLRRTLEVLKKENVIRGVSITGGEPFTDVQLLNEIIALVFEVFGEHFEVTLYTNGLNIGQLSRIDNLYLLDALHISRHHYDDDQNDELFGIRMPRTEELSEILHSYPFPDLFVLNTLLLQGYIDSTEQVHRYLEYTSKVGAGKACFITPIPVNEMSIQRGIDYRDVIKREDPKLLFTGTYTDYEWCRCQDGIYLSNDGDIVHFYGRSTGKGSCGYARGLVYHADNSLTVGFDGETLC